MIVASDSYLKLSRFQTRNRTLVGDWDDGTVDSEKPTAQCCLCFALCLQTGRGWGTAMQGGCFPPPRAIPKASMTWKVQDQSLNALNVPASVNWQRFGSFNALLWSRSGRKKDARCTGYHRHWRERQPLVNQPEIQSRKQSVQSNLPHA